MNQVVESLKTIIAKTNITTENCQTGSNFQSTSIDEHKFNQTNINISSNIDNSLHGELSQVIQSFGKLNTKEILFTTLINENSPSEKNLSTIVSDIVNYIFKIDK